MPVAAQDIGITPARNANMCPSSSTTTKHPLSRVRTAQAIVSLASLPCAIASIPITHGGAETWIQLAAIIVSLITPLPHLYRYRYRDSNSKKQIRGLEVFIDGLVFLFLLGTYIGGIAVIATRRIATWEYAYKYRLGRGIPQIYSNLFCLLLTFLWFSSFAKGVRYLHAHRKQRGVTYTLCPSCGHSPDARANQDLNETAEVQGRASTSTEDMPVWYRDNDREAETRPLIQEQGTEQEGKQETGTVTVTETAAIETLVDVMDPVAAQEFIVSKKYKQNPIGVDIVLEELIEKSAAGVDERSVTGRPNIGPRGPPTLV